MVGDLSSGRTARSLCYLLGKFKDIEIIFISPENLKMKKFDREAMGTRGLAYERLDQLTIDLLLGVR